MLPSLSSSRRLRRWSTFIKKKLIFLIQGTRGWWVWWRKSQCCQYWYQRHVDRLIYRYFSFRFHKKNYFLNSVLDRYCLGNVLIWLIQPDDQSGCLTAREFSVPRRKRVHCLMPRPAELELDSQVALSLVQVKINELNLISTRYKQVEFCSARLNLPITSKYTKKSKNLIF